MILAIDTATRWTGLALHSGSAILAEFGWRATNTQTVELAPTVADLLRKTGVGFSDLTALAVAIGPGSYTGLRVGLGFAKGIALAHNLPLIGISTLDVLAASFGEPEAKEDAHLVAVAEAGRKRVCAATYRWYSRKKWQVKQEADIYEWEQLLKTIPADCRIVGEISAEIRPLLREQGHRPLNPTRNTRRAGQLAHLAHRRFKKGLVDSAALVPIYLRQPDGAR